MLREKLLDLDEELGVRPSEYAMQLIPFREIALTHGTTEALKIFAYVYYMRDPRSLFAGSSEEARHEEIKQRIFHGTFEVDELTQVALDFYNSEETSILKLLRASRSSIDKLQEWLNKIDITDPDYSAIEHTRVLEGLGKTVEAMKKLEEAAEAETSESAIYGGVHISKYNE